jgi:hypothetical protein
MLQCLIWFGSQHFLLVVLCGVKRFSEMVVAVIAIVGRTLRMQEKGRKTQLILT